MTDRELLDNYEKDWYGVAMDYGKVHDIALHSLDCKKRVPALNERLECIEESDELLDKWLDLSADLGRIATKVEA